MGQNGGETEAAEATVTVVKSKLVVVGDCECGKTSLIKRYVHGEHRDVSITV